MLCRCEGCIVLGRSRLRVLGGKMREGGEKK